MTVRVASKGGKKWQGKAASGVGNRARERKGRVLVVAVITETVIAVVGKTILNSLITGVIFEEIVLSDSRLQLKLY